MSVRGEGGGDRAWYTLWHCVCFTVHWIARQTRSPLLLPSLLYVFSSVRRGWWCQSSLGIAKVITFNMKRTAAQPQERGYGMSVCECVYPSLSPFLFVRARIKINADISHIFCDSLWMQWSAEERGREGVGYTMRVDSTSCDH